jgi:hypothetical protein
MTHFWNLWCSSLKCLQATLLTINLLWYFKVNTWAMFFTLSYFPRSLLLCIVSLMSQKLRWLFTRNVSKTAMNIKWSFLGRLISSSWPEVDSSSSRPEVKVQLTGNTVSSIFIYLSFLRFNLLIVYFQTTKNNVFMWWSFSRSLITFFFRVF